MKRVRFAAIALTIGALALGCGSDPTGTSKDPAQTGADAGTTGGEADQGAANPNAVPPSASFADLVAYRGVQGTIELPVQVNESVDKVELLVGGEVKASAAAAPFTIAFDSTTAADGLAQLALRAFAGEQQADGPATPVVIYNAGEKAQWLDGNGGEMLIAPDVDAHLKYHWNMPAGIARVIGVLSWDNPEFEMDLAIGTGGCPHSGKEAMRVASATTPSVVDFTAGGLLTETMWFAHASATNEATLEGKQSNLSIEIYLLR